MKKVKIINNVNNYLEDLIDFFNLKEGERLICFDCTSDLNSLCKKLFICRFLYDSINKGIEYHRNWMKDHKESIAKRISADEIPKIFTNFDAIIENKDLIIILAYDFFINYIAIVISNILRKNNEFLKNLNLIEYKGYEIIDRLQKDPNTIINDLIKVFLYGKKEEGSLPTNPEFWLKTLNGVKIKISEEMIGFWKVLHIRRNAYSHLHVKDKWVEISKNLNNIDFFLWLYGIINLSYKIDKAACRIYKLKKKVIILIFLEN